MIVACSAERSLVMHSIYMRNTRSTNLRTITLKSYHSLALTQLISNTEASILMLFFIMHSACYQHQQTVGDR
jgi:hypothetical protein